jgi:uncharacterized protein YyaL (SSP411 family)
MFLTPEGKPFWGGTYFPRESRYGRPGFKHVLSEISRIWRHERDKVTSNSTALVQALQSESRPNQEKGELTPQLLDTATQALTRAVDPIHGGLKGSPKFPQAPLFGFLWAMARNRLDATAANAVLITLRNICQGGIYDHLGGGIARYSTDHLWLVPHFEKMLYDNAQLIALLARVWPTTRDNLFRVRIEETILFVLNEMRVASGAFAASYDADSEGEEGRYYVWTADEIAAALPPGEAEFFGQIYGVTPQGNWEGKTILSRLGHPELLSDAHEARLAELRSALLSIRRRRVPPAFDDKVLADWNGLMITALAEASVVFGREDWADAGRHAFSAVLDHLWTGTRLRHSWRNGETRHEATADGYANLIAASLALGAISPGGDHLEWAKRLTDAMTAHHWDADRGAFCLSAADASMVIVRPVYGQDDATPNANAVMIENLTRLFHLAGDRAHLDRAQTILDTFSAEALANPFAYTSLMRAFAFLADPIQIVIAGGVQDPFSDRRFRAAIDAVGPDCVVQWVSAADALPPAHPARAKAAAGKQRLYVCRGPVCAAPAESEAEARQALELLGLGRGLPLS